MKKAIALILCVCLLLPILAGCEMNITLKEGVPMKGQTNTPGNNSGNNGGNINLDDLDIEIPKEVTEFWDNYDWDNYDPADLHVTLGDATFSIDNHTDAKDTGVFTPGEELILSVADYAGLVWTLGIPGDALLDTQTITMTALRDIVFG
jgi:hypothetical protein